VSIEHFVATAVSKKWLNFSTCLNFEGLLGNVFVSAWNFNATEKSRFNKDLLLNHMLFQEHVFSIEATRNDFWEYRVLFPSPRTLALHLYHPASCSYNANLNRHQSRTQKNFMGGVFSSGSYGGHLYLLCAVCDVTIWLISMFPNQRLGEVCWYNNAYFSTSTPLIFCVIALNISYQRSKLGYRRKTNSTLPHSSSLVQKYQAALKQGSEKKTGEWNTLITTSGQFTAAKWGCAKVSSNTSSWALKVCGWTGWRTSWFARSNVAKLH